MQMAKVKEKEKEKEKLCKAHSDSSNSSSSCQFHPSFFVCRSHNDKKRYYELEPDDLPYANFYDSCEAEDPDTSG